MMATRKTSIAIVLAAATAINGCGENENPDQASETPTADVEPERVYGEPIDHKVQLGETLSDIVLKYSTREFPITAREIAEYNNLRCPHTGEISTENIYTGTVIKIPQPPAPSQNYVVRGTLALTPEGDK